MANGSVGKPAIVSNPDLRLDKVPSFIGIHQNTSPSAVGSTNNDVLAATERNTSTSDLENELRRLNICVEHAIRLKCGEPDEQGYTHQFNDSAKMILTRTIESYQARAKRLAELIEWRKQNKEYQHTTVTIAPINHKFSRKARHNSEWTIRKVRFNAPLSANEIRDMDQSALSAAEITLQRQRGKTTSTVMPTGNLH